MNNNEKGPTMTDDNERPIGPGDYVEWHPSPTTHIKGEVTAVRSLAGADFATVRIDYDRAHPAPHSWQGQTHELGCARLRRIPRPAEVQATVRRGTCCAHPVERHHYAGCADCGCGLQWKEHPDRDLDMSPAGRAALGHVVPASPAPVLVDGLTRDECLERFVTAMQMEAPFSAVFTPAQLAAAREEWSAALRAKVAASDEAERCRVTYCEVDDE